MLDTAESFNDGAPVSENVTISAAGTVEPKSWLPGQLLAEISGVNVTFGAWVNKPLRQNMQNVGIMAPPFDGGQRPPGVLGQDYIIWFSGEIKLDAGAQKIVLAAATTAGAFLEILNGDGTAFANCTEAAECSVTAPAAGWYVLHMGWKHPSTAADHAFELQWAAGSGTPTPLELNRLRVATFGTATQGWLVEGHEFQRSISHLTHGTALNYKTPFALTWSPSLLGLDGNGASPSYRNAGQVRILDGGTYDFTVTAQDEAAYRLWINGEWTTKPAAWDPQPSGVRTETITRMLAPGWHDVVLEGYEQGGTGNSVKFTFGKAGQPSLAPAVADVRPLLSATTQFITGANLNTLQLVKGVAVSELLSINPVANAPSASAVDVWLRLKPKVWAGLDVKLKAPNGASIPLTITTNGLTDDVLGDVHASLTADQLGAANVSGNWTVEVTHPDAGGPLNAGNALSRARLTVHYKGAPTIGEPQKQITENGHYSRMVSLDQQRELRGLVVTGVQPQGSTINASLQICTDATGTSCQPGIPAAQVGESKTPAQHVKITVAFTSDGYASPILDKLALRYKE